MTSLDELHKEIEAIKKRNAVVETHKAWETTFFRRLWERYFHRK